MKFLFVVQGEGRGHLTQSIALKNILTKNGHEVTAVLVGKSKHTRLPFFFAKKMNIPVHCFNSPSFLWNKKVNVFLSIIYNLFKIPIYFKSINFIYNKVIKSNVDIVVNFYELIISLSYAIFSFKIPCISIAHQYSILHPEYNLPPENKFKLVLLKFFTHLTCIKSSMIFAISMENKKNVLESRIIIVPPLLREEIFKCIPQKKNYLHGYIINSSLSDEIIKSQKKYPYVHLHFFWDKKNVPQKLIINDHLTFHTLNDKLFIKYMSECKAYITTAGFESVCEAMYLGKPILMVPTHIEQNCNAYEASLAGAGIKADNFDINLLINYIPKYKKNVKFQSWVEHSEEYWINEINKFISLFLYKTRFVYLFLFCLLQ
ncbi:MAG: glycosyltransferase [Bacteroidales bacterium OttesenSCG-928-I14]|jgi:uncharacterized protein (TIGR00661 family)|nr:glycosyltransferase [Bacteroidales bacterium OttesenSCG-928-I14]